MSVIEKLDSVLELVGIAIDSDERSDQDAADESAFNFLRDHGPAIRQDMIDARRYRWLRDCDSDGEDAVMLRMSDFGRDELLSGEELDAAIDARLASDSEGGE